MSKELEEKIESLEHRLSISDKFYNVVLRERDLAYVQIAKLEKEKSQLTGDMHLTEAEVAFDEFVKSRREQGRVTYGQGLDHRDARWDWRQMALEEMVDGCQYLIAEVKRLQDRIKELENGK